MGEPLVTVVELPDFGKRASKLLTKAARTELVNHLAANPTDGVELGSGVRKLRWGSRGAFRVVHFFADDRSPVFLIDIFAKADAANYSEAGLVIVHEIAKAKRPAKRRAE